MKATSGLYITLGALLFAIIFLSPGYMAYCEWATGIYYILFFAIIMSINTFYETVHDKADLGNLLQNSNSNL